MKRFSAGFAAPGAVIFLAVIGLVVWYRHHNEATTSVATTTTTVYQDIYTSLEAKLPTLR